MKRIILLIIAVLMLVCVLSVSSFAEEYTDSLTLTDAEAEFFELTDDEKANFGPKKNKGFKEYRISAITMIESLSQGGSINDILARSLDEKDYMKNSSIIMIKATNNGCFEKFYIDKILTNSNASDWWKLKDYILYTERVPQLEGLNISNIYCITSEHSLGGGETIFYYVTDKGDYVILLSNPKVYFMPASVLIECAEKHVENNTARYEMLASVGGGAFISDYLISQETPEPTPAPEPTPDITELPEITPTPSVTDTPVSKPTNEPTPVVTPTPSSPVTTTTPAGEPQSPVWWIALGAAVIILGLLGVFVIRRKR